MRILARKVLPSILCLALISGCSWMSRRKRLFDTEEKANPKQVQNTKKKMDPKQVQYEELLTKYEKLKRNKNDSEMKTNPAISSPDLISKINQAPQDGKMKNTVDVFAKNQVRKEETIEMDFSNRGVEISDELLEQEIKVLREGISHLGTRKYELAMKNFKMLEASKSPQVAIRAKYYIGELLFVQKEYDLAMQVFEDVLQNGAFSGVVLKTLGKLVVCSEKLNLKVKQNKYYSILHDFFGS